MVAKGSQGVKWMEILRIGEGLLVLLNLKTSVCVKRAEMALVFLRLSSQSGLLVPVTCVVRGNVRTALLLYP